MGTKTSSKQLAKLLLYVLGRRPDEFGLVPDQEGYIKIKELLQAINEEEGVGFVGRALIDELLITQPDPAVEITGNLIRAVDRQFLKPSHPEENPPKLLYVSIKQKSYPVVSEKGISPTYADRIILSSDEKMAIRIGKRRGSSPTILTVNVQQARNAGVKFQKAGELLFLTDFIPPECFTGPPLPKQKIEPKKQERQTDFEKKQMAGSFLMDFERLSTNEEKSGSWKRDKKRLRRQKQKKWPT